MSIASLYTTKIHSIHDVRRAAEQLAQIGRVMGDYKVAACDNLASKQPMVDAEGNILADEVFGFHAAHERWWANSRLALTSPIPRACRYESEPFWCNIQGFHTRQYNPYLEKMDVADFEKRACCKSAIVIPVHLPLGQIGALAFNPHDGRQDLSADFERFADDLEIVAHKFISGYLKVTRNRLSVPGDCQLTKREVECLRWAAVGKTDKEISMILSRSHATVRFHIKNAGEKLNTVNRSQTIFKAAQLGFLSAAA